jgi:hypothetical protein
MDNAGEQDVRRMKGIRTASAVVASGQRTARS